MQQQQQTATRPLFTRQPQSHGASSDARARQRSDGNQLSHVSLVGAAPPNHTALVVVPPPETAAADTAAVADTTAAAIPANTAAAQAAAHAVAHAAAAAAVAETTAAEEEAAAVVTRAPAETTAAGAAAAGGEKGNQSSSKAAADIANKTRALKVLDRVCVDEVLTAAACSVYSCEEPEIREFKALGGVAAPQLTGSNYHDSKNTQRVRRATEILKAETADDYTTSVTPGLAAAAFVASDHIITVTTRATTAATGGGGGAPSSYSHSSSATTDGAGAAAAAYDVGMRELNIERRRQHKGCNFVAGSERTEGKKKKKKEKLRDLEAREHRETLKESIVGDLETRDNREGLKDSEEKEKENGEKERKKRKEATVATGDDIITQRGRRQDEAEENEETDPIEYEELVYLTFPELSMSSVFTPTVDVAAAASEKEEVRKAARRAEESLSCSHEEAEVTAKTVASAKLTERSDAGTRDDTQKTKEKGGDECLLHDTSVSTHSVGISTTKEVSTPANTIEAAIQALWQSHCEERSAVTTVTSTNNTTKNSEQREHVCHENDAGKEEGHGGEGRKRRVPPMSHHTVNCQDSHEAATTSDEHTGNCQESSGAATISNEYTVKCPESNEAATNSGKRLHCSSAGAAGLTSCRIQLFDIESEKPLALINESLSFVGRTSRLDALETLLFLRCDQHEQQQRRAEQTQGHVHQRNNDDCHEMLGKRSRRWHHNNAVNTTLSRNIEKPLFAEGLTRHKIEFVVDSDAAAAQRAGAALEQPAPLP